MTPQTRDLLQKELSEIRSEGLEKNERILTTPQRSRISTGNGFVINLCANNYLGLADHPKIAEAAHQAIDEWGYGLASVRFICGTQSIHRQLENDLSHFLGQDDTILYTSCFDANGGLFETILGDGDAVFSDELNHASIIDGIRLCKAKRFRYHHRDMNHLDGLLKGAKGSRIRLIVTDGVFSMDGTLAPLPELCDLAEKHGALLMVDDSHATGFLGPGGKGTPERFGVEAQVDILTGTLGKALGGASGGYVSAAREVVELLRQRSRPYLFSNSLPPSIVAASIRALELIASPEGERLREQLHRNTTFFREGLESSGFDVLPGTHPIIPILLHDAYRARAFAERLLEKGVYVIPFSFPVVPRGKARIRTQISATHRPDQLNTALAAFREVAKEVG
ncbi:MAG: glycine C-acetyltransferase [Verrucomicrobiota bacterium]